MPRSFDQMDAELHVTNQEVAARCRHCPWEAHVSTAPAGVDLVRQARLECFGHLFEAHSINAWDAGLAYR